MRCRKYSEMILDKLWRVTNSVSDESQDEPYFYVDISLRLSTFTKGCLNKRYYSALGFDNIYFM